MQITRRRLMASASAALTASALPHRGWTETRLALGETEILTLSDGMLTLPADFIFGAMPQDELAPILSRFGMDATAPLTPPCNITLLRQGDVLALFDAGSGMGFQSGVGRLPDALAAAGIDPMDITHVIFTHGHPDHLWGALDDFDEPLFANATHMMGQAEFDYWMDDATVDSIGAERATFAVGAKRRLEVLASDMVLFADAAEVLPGVMALATPGHTPGHMCFSLGQGADGVMILGDAIGNGHIAFARPDWLSNSDQDPAQGAQTRVALFERIMTSGMAVVGFHLPEGGMGRVEAAPEGYAFAPLT
jgi:glyoxylase-like metal-dependent hydrolase (beta-lactamase superfamily II)